MEGLNDLKVGDKVILTISWGYREDCVKTVEKITPSGLIRAGGYLFYKDGHVRGNTDARIRKWSQEEEDKINCERLKMITLIDCSKCKFEIR